MKIAFRSQKNLILALASLKSDNARIDGFLQPYTYTYKSREIYKYVPAVSYIDSLRIDRPRTAGTSRV